MSVYAEDRLTQRMPAPGEERVVARSRNDSAFSVAHIDQRGVLTYWEQNQTVVLDGDAEELLRLSGITVPDGVARRHRLSAGVGSGASRMSVAGVTHVCGVALDPQRKTLAVERAVRNRSRRTLRGDFASVWGIALHSDQEPPKIVSNNGGFGLDDLQQGETVVRMGGDTFAVELGGRSISCSSDAMVISDEIGIRRPELRLLMHRAADMLYVGAAVCGSEAAVLPHQELRIDSVVTLQ